MITPEQIDKIIEFIKQASQTVYGVLLKQIYIDGGIKLFFIVISFITLIIIFKSWKFIAKDTSNLSIDEKEIRIQKSFWLKLYEKDNDAVMWYLLTTGTGFLVSIGYILANFKWVITAFLNPNYLLIMQLVNTVK